VVLPPEAGHAAEARCYPDNSCGVRVEHNRDTLLVHISDEEGHGWTTLAIDRATREWSIAQRRRQRDAAKAAYSKLYL
jgi:hypothetical protein